LAVTSTLGGAISGKSVMGRVNKDNPPNKSKMMEMTVDNTGRSINFRSIIVSLEMLMECPLSGTLLGAGLAGLIS
jgi:hypothetical protein